MKTDAPNLELEKPDAAKVLHRVGCVGSGYEEDAKDAKRRK